MRLKLPNKAKARYAQRHPGQMSRWEADYATLLFLGMSTGQIQHFLFEPLKLRLGKDFKTTYTPDFMVVAADGTLELHEVKAHWEEDARAKTKIAAAMYPQFKFIAAHRKSQKQPWQFEEF